MTPTNFSLERYQANTSNDNEPIGLEDLSYFRQRLKNDAFQGMMAKFAERVEQDGFSKSLMADRLGKDRGQISRLFAGPKNWTLDTLSDLALALDFEPEISFGDLRSPSLHNFCHSWTDKASPANISASDGYIVFGSEATSASQSASWEVGSPRASL